MRRRETKTTTVQWPPQDVYLFGIGYLRDSAGVLTLYITSRIYFMPLIMRISLLLQLPSAQAPHPWN